MHTAETLENAAVLLLAARGHFLKRRGLVIPDNRSIHSARPGATGANLQLALDPASAA